MTLEQALTEAGFDALSLGRLDWVATVVPAYELHVSGERAVESWHSLRSNIPDAGYWPVLLGDHAEVSRIAEGAQINESNHGSPAEILAASETVDVAALRRRWETEAVAGDDAEFDIEGDWPTDLQPPINFEIPLDRSTRRPIAEVVMALLPVRNHWEVAAVLEFGDFNGIPVPHEHVAVLRDWARRFDAELVGMSSDTIELRVGQPPSTQEVAVALAREQYGYCPDIVDQDRGTISDLAAALLGSSTWHFWFD